MNGASEQARAASSGSIVAGLVDALEGLSADDLHTLADRIDHLLEAKDDAKGNEAALLSESSLAKDWGRPEEDEAWRDL